MVLTDDQKALQETARRFARERLLPDYQKREKTGVLDRALVAEMGRLGLLGMDLPEEFGGLGTDAVTTGLITEALAYGDFNISAIPVGISLNGAILMRHAQPEVVNAWVPRMIRGEAIIAICLTEPRGGSDAGNLQLRARRDGDSYVLNGEKTSITFADCADAFLVFARTGLPADGAKGVSAFFIPGDIPGISRTRFDDVGSAVTGRGSVFFDDVRVPASHRLGEEGKGFTQVMQGFDYSRALIALQCCGAAQASLDEAWAYAAEREAFGRPIGQFQGVSFPLAEGESHIAAVRQLSYHALAQPERGNPFDSDAARAQLQVLLLHQRANRGTPERRDPVHTCVLAHLIDGLLRDHPPVAHHHHALNSLIR